MEEGTGKIVVEKVGGKSTVTRCFSKYPLKFIIPRKVGPSKTDAVWIYSLSYGGGIVSGDCILCDFTIGDDCTTVLTTQASTKVYKSLDSKCSQQVLEASIGSNALLVVIPDPVTCFSTARYSQRQVFRLVSDSSLVIVDWITSGRHESGEIWDFEHYKSTNNIFIDGDQPLFLDTVLLERENSSSIAERMKGYQVVAMVILLGPKLVHIRNQVQEDVKRMMSVQLHPPTTGLEPSYKRAKSDHCLTKPAFMASCSAFGPKYGSSTARSTVLQAIDACVSHTHKSPTVVLQHHAAAVKDPYPSLPCYASFNSVINGLLHGIDLNGLLHGIGTGLVVRIAAMTTESVYNFLRHQLASMETLLGVSPYC